MQRNLNFDDFSNEDKDIKNSGKSVFQVGVFLCITGIILLLIGMISVSIFQINYQTESKIVMPIVCCIGVALIFITVGNNCMIHEGKTWLFSSAIGVFLTFISIVIFLFYYETNWFYPLISYILILYVIGLIILMGNTLWFLPLSLFSSLINQSNFRDKGKIFEHIDNNNLRKGIAKQKLSFLDVVDDIKSYDMSSMKDMVLETESESYLNLSLEDELTNKTNIQLDDSSRRKIEAYQLMQEK